MVDEEKRLLPTKESTDGLYMSTIKLAIPHDPGIYEIARIWLTDAFHFREALPLPNQIQRRIHRILHGSIFWTLRKLTMLLIFFVPFFEYSFEYPDGSFLFIGNFLQFVILVILTSELLMRATVIGYTRFVNDKLLVAFTCILLIDCLDLILSISKAPLLGPTRPLRVLRVFFVIAGSPQLIANAVYFTTAIPTVFLQVLFLFAVHLFIFSVLAMVIIPRDLFHTINGGSNFLAYFITHIVLMSTAIFPNIAIPSFESNNFYLIYFVIFLVIAGFYLIDLLVAQVFLTYKHSLKSDLEFKLQRQENAFRNIFNLFALNEPFIDSKETLTLLRELFPKLPHRNVVKALNSEPNASITFQRFSSLLYTLHKQRVQPKWRTKVADAIDTMCLHRVRSLERTRSSLKMILVSKTARLISLLFTLLTGVITVIQVDNPSFFQSIVLDKQPVGYLIFNIICIIWYLVEFMLYVFVFKSSWFLTYWVYSLQVIHLFVFIICSFTCSWRIVLALRVFFLLRTLVYLERVRVLIRVTLSILPVFAVNLLFLASFMYVYAITGMFIFEGKFLKGNPLLANTDYDFDNFYGVDFDTYSSALFTVFHLVLINNWQVTMPAAARVTNDWAYLYFISYYLLVALVMLSVVLAFFVDLFTGQVESGNNNGDIDEADTKDDESVHEQSVVEWKLRQASFSPSGTLERRPEDVEFLYGIQ